MSLEGRVALVTGAAAGIGRAVVARFVAEGASVVALDRSESGLARLLDDVPGPLLAVLGDVVRPEDHSRAVSEAGRVFGPLDVLVANAGVFDGNVPVLERGGADLSRLFDDVFGTNVKGYLLAARAAAHDLRSTRGSVVMTASVAGLAPGFGGALYVASKHAVIGLMRQLALEFAPAVRVNAVAPGYVETGLADADRAGGGPSLAAPERVRRRVPLRMTPKPAQVTAPYVLLASDEGRFITGSVLTIDGGQSLAGPPPLRTEVGEPPRGGSGGKDV